jgi:hypothetical protein
MHPLDKAVHLFAGGLAVVAGDAQMDALGQHPGGEAVRLLLHLARYPDGVGSPALGDGDRDGRVVLEPLDAG